MTTQKAQRKAAQRALVASRLTAALSDMYGNGRVTRYPKETEPEGYLNFWEWLGDYASREVDYMGADNFGMTEEETRAPNFYSNARQRLESARMQSKRDPVTAAQVARVSRSWILSEARNRYAFPSGEWERAHAVLIRRAHDWLTGTRASHRDPSRTIRETRVYQHGRMGKTFYPERFAESHVGGFYPKEGDAWSYAERVEVAQFIEQFNAHIRAIAKGAADVYTEEARERLEEKAETARDEMRDARETFHALKLELRALGNLNAPNVCNVMRANLARLARDVHANAAQLSRINSTIANLGA